MSDLCGASLDTSSVSSVQVLVLGSQQQNFDNFRRFLIARSITGLFAGCNPVFKAGRGHLGLQGVASQYPLAQAYLADVVPSERLPRFMVLREASATLAFIIGPTVGGFLTMDPGVGQDGGCCHVCPLMVSRGFNSCYLAVYQ